MYEAFPESVQWFTKLFCPPIIGPSHVSWAVADGIAVAKAAITKAMTNAEDIWLTPGDLKEWLKRLQFRNLNEFGRIMHEINLGAIENPNINGQRTYLPGVRLGAFHQAGRRKAYFIVDPAQRQERRPGLGWMAANQ